ncbi:MAG: hypothetical protein JW808_01030 [Victivallales bacterium]|nr:hypothetical protein [Victivallales bacterium]
MKAEELLDIISGVKRNDLDTLALLDANGIIAAPDDNIVSFKKRHRKLLSNIIEFEKELQDKEKIPLFDSITVSSKSKIPDNIIMEAAEINRTRYHFQIQWIPGFFTSQSLGLLWGGCAISFPENALSIFLIRANFAKKRRWLLYRRDELLSHEICHIARIPINDRAFEEHFAYALSPSRLRRYLGNCFQSSRDATLFLTPFLILLAAQTTQFIFNIDKLPIFPFWILAALYPAFLLARNQKSRNTISKARKNLAKAGLSRPDAILFRCTRDEIYTIAAFSRDMPALREWLGKRARSRLRWRIIYERFIRQDTDSKP